MLATTMKFPARIGEGWSRPFFRGVCQAMWVLVTSPRPPPRPGRLVERAQQPLAGRVAVLGHGVPDDHRGRGGAPLAGEVAELLRPERLSVHGEAVQPALAEERDDPLAVGRAGRGRPPVLG